MGEVMFYHLTTTPLARALPDLLQRALDRGWPVVLRAGAETALPGLDDLLWSFDDASFLPHGTAEMGQDARQPVFLTTRAENPNGAKVLMLVEGARVDPGEAAAYDRVCLLFDGRDSASLAAAREDWVRVRDGGVSGIYWAQKDGPWSEQARTEPG
ncbi:MAG: DNA polymerase III subunit chi [Pseudomonadota bacterium]